MRALLFSSLLLVSQQLVAQAPPAPVNYAAIYEEEAKALTPMLKSFKAREAANLLQAKAGLPLPAFNKPSEEALLGDKFQETYRAIFVNKSNYSGLAGLNYLYSYALMTSGEWEKSLTPLDRAIEISKQNQRAFAEATDLIPALYQKDVAFLREEHAKVLASAEGQRFKAIQTQPEANRMDSDKQFCTDFESRQKRREEDIKALLAQIDSCTKGFAGVRSEIEKSTQLFENTLKERRQKLQQQQDEIKTFNDAWNAKNAKLPKKQRKAPLVGPNAWVNQIVSAQTSFKGLQPDDCCGALSRLAVLDPTNEKVQKALKNVTEGKAPLAKGTGTKKSVGKKA